MTNGHHKKKDKCGKAKYKSGGQTLSRRPIPLVTNISTFSSNRLMPFDSNLVENLDLCSSRFAITRKCQDVEKTKKNGNDVPKSSSRESSGREELPGWKQSHGTEVIWMLG